MKAAVLHAFGTPLSVEDRPDPVLGTGEVLVDMEAAPVLSYAKEVLSGERRYLLDLPAVPGLGGVGRVHAVGPDATRLRPDDWVYCDCTVRARDDQFAPDITLQGVSARGEGGQLLQRYHRDGAWAQKLRLPTENVTRLGDIDKALAAQWSTLGIPLVPYGGLLAARFEPGETLLVSGATGPFGGACVAVALAMGAGCVLAAGRNTAVLDELRRGFGSRLRPVPLSGEEHEDRRRMAEAAPPGGIDCVLDILPPSAPATVARAAVMAVRPYGRVVLMGGVGMLGGPGLDLPYPWIMRNCLTIHGQWMYAADAVPRLARLVQAGLLDLSRYAVTEFPLAEANAAVAHAASHAGPFKATVLRP